MKKNKILFGLLALTMVFVGVQTTRAYIYNPSIGNGTGTVTSFSVVTANGVSATVANSTSTPAATFTLGVLTPTSVAATGLITTSSPSASFGYATGAGCAVTQITSRTTGVSCTGNSGAITTDTTSLAAEATAKFTVTDTSVAVGDTVVASIRSGSNSGGTIVAITTVAAGSFQIAVQNNNVAAGTAETGAIIINFAVVKAVSS